MTPIQVWVNKSGFPPAVGPAWPCQYAGEGGCHLSSTNGNPDRCQAQQCSKIPVIQPPSSSEQHQAENAQSTKYRSLLHARTPHRRSNQESGPARNVCPPFFATFSPLWSWVPVNFGKAFSPENLWTGFHPPKKAYFHPFWHCLHFAGSRYLPSVLVLFPTFFSEGFFYSSPIFDCVPPLSTQRALRFFNNNCRIESCPKM